MGLGVYGILAAQNVDNSGETILIEGIDNSQLHLIKDEHPEKDEFYSKVGAIKYSKKIFSAKDCENDKQIRCWNHALVPFLYGEGELADDQDHPNAQASAAMLKFTQRPDIPLSVGWSIDGGITQRTASDGQPTEDKELGNILAKTVAIAGSLTVKPCNPKCLAFIDADLTKSISTMSPPLNYLALLRKSQSKTSFNECIESNQLELFIQVEKLKKSVDDYFSGFTSMRCNGCGKPVRFFKSTGSMPHKCGACSNTFSMKEIWKAINK